jgi:hypothetical protein
VTTPPIDPTQPQAPYPQQPPYYQPPQQPIVIRQETSAATKLGIGISATMLFIIPVPAS